MIVYHGSNSNFKKLKIAKNLVKHESTLTNEGLGIYFSTDKRVAESYGKYVYTIEIDDKYFIDFRNLSKCTSYMKMIISTIYKKTDIRIDNYFSVNEIINRIYFGAQAISSLGWSIAEILDNTDKFYFDYNKTTREKIYTELRRIDKNLKLAYMFNYHIKNIGVIKYVDDENIVKILEKEVVS